MKSKLSALIFASALLLLLAGVASADDYDDTIAVFKKSGESAAFFDHSYGYAVFPSIGKGGLGVGAAHGSGRVYEQGKHVGDVKMNQISVGLQAGGQAFREVIFFKDKTALDDFTRGNFEFQGGLSAVALKEGVSKSLNYNKGVAVVSAAKGGLMAEASVGGQKFKYEPVKENP